MGRQVGILRSMRAGRKPAACGRRIYVVTPTRHASLRSAGRVTWKSAALRDACGGWRSDAPGETPLGK